MVDMKDLMGSKHTGRATTDSQSGGKRRRHRGSRRTKRAHRAKRHSTGKRGRKSARRMHRKRGGSVIATAALPFSLLGLQKFFHTRKGRKDLKKVSRGVSKTARRIRRSI